MNKKTSIATALTKEDLCEILDDKLQNYPTKDDFKQLRSDFFTRFDEIIGELAQTRENWLFTNHEIKQLKETNEEYEKRIKKLEKHVVN